MARNLLKVQVAADPAVSSLDTSLPWLFILEPSFIQGSVSSLFPFPPPAQPSFCVGVGVGRFLGLSLEPSLSRGPLAVHDLSLGSSSRTGCPLFS